MGCRLRLLLDIRLLGLSPFRWCGGFGGLLLLHGAEVCFFQILLDISNGDYYYMRHDTHE
jgi:hypothetical protein